MAKKYIKNENGIVRAVTSENLQLEKPLANENYDIKVHNRNMDKIDSAIQDVKGKIDGLELVASKVAMADGSTVEDTVTTNKTNILKINADIEDLKLSVSNGKTLIASAITDKEVPTSNTDSFQVMANNIKNIKTGINVTMDGEPLDYDFELEFEGGNWMNSPKLQYDFYYGSAVVYNNEIHILGGGGNVTIHYKYNGSSWVSVSTLPYRFQYSSAVVYNNEIHIMGSSYGSSYYTKHYKYNGSSWVSASTLPYDFYCGSAVVYNNEIHILGSAGGQTKHYKYNGSTWSSVSTLPYTFYKGSAVVYNNEIHILGCYVNDNSYKHYKYNGSSWSSVSALPYSFYDGLAVVYNNEIHIMGANDSTNGSNHYKYNGSSWSPIPIMLPCIFYQGSGVVHNNEIHILGGSGSKALHFKFAELYKVTKK